MKDCQKRGIIVTGANGFVGRNIVRGFERYPDKVYVVPWTRGKNTTITGHFAPIIIHCAAELKDESKMFESNVLLTEQLLSNAGRFIYVGSSAEYGICDGPITENTPLNPQTMYAVTKAAGSQLCYLYRDIRKHLGQTWVDYTNVVRPFSLYGEGDNENKFFGLIVKHLLSGKMMRITEGYHDWLHISDFVDGVMRVTDICGKEWPTDFNFGTGIQTSNWDVVKLFERVSGRKLKKKSWDESLSISGQANADNWVCDNTRARKTLNWEPKISLEEGIHNYWHYVTGGHFE